MKRTVARGLQRAWFARSVEWRVLVALSLLLSVVVVSNRFGVFTPDTKPEIFLQPGQTARRFAASWLDTPNLGAPNYNTGVAPLAALFAVFEGLGTPAWLITRIWRVGLLLLAAWGARTLVRDMVGSSVGHRGAAVAGVVAAIAYAANPYVVVGGGTTPTLQPYALLPWFVLCLLRGFRTPSWRWAVLAALFLAGMGGLNAGVVPALQLVVLIPLITHALLVERLRVGAITWVLFRTAVVFLLLSAYWLVPALAAVGVGTSIAESTESVAGINSANSFAEVIRGLGMWTLYGIGSAGPFDPDRLAYVTGPVVVLLSFGGPALAGVGVLLSRSPARIFAATSVLVGALVMVGSFPMADPTHWGRALNALIEAVPGMVALRTTNKAGAVLELGLAVLIGLAAAAISSRVVGVVPRAVAVAAGAAIVAGSVAPALSGDLFSTRLDLPEYWAEVAADLNDGGASRVLMIPGVAIPSYTWGYSGPDEIGPSLFERPFVFRSASPSGGAPAATLLSEVDRRLQQGTLPEGTMSALADYLGVGDVIARYDISRGEALRDRVERQLEDDNGLGPPRTFGPDGATADAPAHVTVRQILGAGPLQSVGVRTGWGALVVDGSGAALPSLSEARLLDARPGLLMSGGLDDAELARAVADGARLVITDSNLRRTWSNTDPIRVGPVLSASADLGASRSLFTSREQSTAELRGNAVLSTTGPGLLFGPFAQGAVEAAFDGDPTTAWLFGNYGTGVGNAVAITPTAPLPMPVITLSAAQGASSAISAVKVTATVGGRPVVREAELSPWSAFPVDLFASDGPVSQLVIEVTRVSGEGDGAVGFSEITIPGLLVSRVVSVSDDLARRAPAATAGAGADLADVPLDVVLRRGAGDLNGLSSDEPRLIREFTLPDDREMRARGSVRLAASVADAAVDRLAGYGGPVVAESSSRWQNHVALRASMALDGDGSGPDLSTAWVPGRAGVGEWIAVEFPARRVETFTVTQDRGPAIATRALVSVDDGDPFQVTLAGGTTNIALPEPTEASKIRVLLTDRFGEGSIRILDIGLPRLMRSSLPPTECLVVGAVDGRPLSVRLTQGKDALLTGQSVTFEGCNPGPFALARGTHLLTGVPDFALDSLHLADKRSRLSERATPPMQILDHTTEAMTVRFPAGCSACLLSSGQAHDPRWTAHTMTGDSLGPPVVVDGYAAGWQIDVEPGTEVYMRYGPSRSAAFAWWVSLAAVLVCVGALLFASGRSCSRREPPCTRGEGSRETGV